MKINDLPLRFREKTSRGVVIPAHPLALDKNRKFDEKHQRALTRYYIDSGAGGVAVGFRVPGTPGDALRLCGPLSSREESRRQVR